MRFIAQDVVIRYHVPSVASGGCALLGPREIGRGRLKRPEAECRVGMMRETGTERGRKRAWDAAREQEASYMLRFGMREASPYLVHLQSPFSIANYIRIADEVARLAQRRTGHARPPDVLDWGAGYGQLTYLLAARGCRVTSYDVGSPGTFPLPIEPARTLIRDDHHSRLPFADGSFDVVVSCGVLEHVHDERASLVEIHRLLRPGGLFLIYNLPQLTGYIELLVRAFRLGYTHERRYSVAGARRLLAAHGFRVRGARRSNLLPHNFRGLPAPIRSALTGNAHALLAADLALSRIPALNLGAGILELVTVRDTGA